MMGFYGKCHTSKSPDDQSLILFPSVFQSLLGKLNAFVSVC